MRTNDVLGSMKIAKHFDPTFCVSKCFLDIIVEEDLEYGCYIHWIRKQLDTVNSK
jgi:hypothetical protein